MIFFDSDFENGLSADGWTGPFDSSGAGQQLEVTRETAFTGNAALKGVWTTLSSPGGGGVNVIHYFDYPTKRIFVRVAMKMVSGFSVGQNHFSKLMRVRGNKNGYPVIWMYNGEGQYLFTVECPYVEDHNYTMWNIPTGIPISTDKWDQVEWEVQLNEPGMNNGYIKCWVNNRQVLDQNVVFVGLPGSYGACNWIRQEENTAFEFLEVFVQSGMGTIYYDRIAAGDSKIGLVDGTGKDTVLSVNVPETIQTELETVPIQIQNDVVSVQQTSLPVRPALLLGESDIPILQSNVQQNVQQLQPTEDHSVMGAAIVAAVAYLLQR